MGDMVLDRAMKGSGSLGNLGGKRGNNRHHGRFGVGKVVGWICKFGRVGDVTLVPGTLRQFVAGKCGYNQR